jgi:hypothetical protein
MTTRDLDRIRFVSRHFNDLQGLRTAFPIGLLLLGFGAMELFRVWPVQLLSFLAVVAAILMSKRRFRLYYQRRFGEVEQLPAVYGAEPSPAGIGGPDGPVPAGAGRRPVNPFMRWLLTPMALALALFVVLRAVSPPVMIQTSASAHPVEGTYGSLVAETEYLICGACFVGVWLWRGRGFSQGYYLVLGILLLALAAFGAALGLALPAMWDLGVASAARYVLPALASLWKAHLLCGAALVLVGLLDHWQIVRVLRPVKEEA